MKDQTDDDTADMFGQKRGPGRPSTGKAKSGAARQAAYRAKQREKSVTVTINRDLLERLDAYNSPAIPSRTGAAESQARLFVPGDRWPAGKSIQFSTWGGIEPQRHQRGRA